MLGIARHHQKVQQQRATVIYFYSDAAVINISDSVDNDYDWSLVYPLTGGVDDVSNASLAYYDNDYSGRSDQPAPFGGFTLPAGTWSINMNYTASTSLYHSVYYPDLPVGPSPHFRIYQGDPRPRPSDPYADQNPWNPVFTDAVRVWRTDLPPPGGGNWAKNVSALAYTITPMEIGTNALTGNSYADVANGDGFITLTEQTNFWITLWAPRGIRYTYSPVEIVVNRIV